MGNVEPPGGLSTRITGLAAASRPSMKTLNTTVGYFARLDPLLMLMRFSSTPANATKRL